MGITELVLTVILLTSIYKNQLLALSYSVNEAVPVKFEGKPLDMCPESGVVHV